MIFFAERIRADHDLEPFSCDNLLLDTWLKGYAKAADRAGTGRTYVWLNESGHVVAYFTLAPHLIQRSELQLRTGRGSPQAIPSILLARLALDRELHGRGLGAELLADALGTALDAVRRAGGRLIVVDAIDASAAAFYEHQGFAPVVHNPHRLVMKARHAARLVSVPWP